MDIVEKKIEAVKELFLSINWMVEIEMWSETEIKGDGSLRKYYECHVVYVDEFDYFPIRFVADENMEKPNEKNAAIYPRVEAPHLRDALAKLYDVCADAIRRNYIVEYGWGCYGDEDDECELWDGK